MLDLLLEDNQLRAHAYLLQYVCWYKALSDEVLVPVRETTHAVKAYKGRVSSKVPVILYLDRREW